MKLIQTLLDAINKIINSIDKEDIEGAKKQISDSYRLLGNEEDYFSKTDYKELIEFFKSKEGNYLKRVKFLAEFIYLEATIEENKILNLDIITIYQHYDCSIKWKVSDWLFAWKWTEFKTHFALVISKLDKNEVFELEKMKKDLNLGIQ